MLVSKAPGLHPTPRIPSACLGGNATFPAAPGGDLLQAPGPPVQRPRGRASLAPPEPRVTDRVWEADRVPQEEPCWGAGASWSQREGHERGSGRGRVGQGGSACRAPRVGLAQEGAGHSHPPSPCLEKVMLGESPGFSTQMLWFSEGRKLPQDTCQRSTAIPSAWSPRPPRTCGDTRGRGGTRRGKVHAFKFSWK